MLKETVQQELVKALKAHDSTRLSTMRMLLFAINYDRINKMHDLSAEEELDAVRKEAKKRSDAIEMYEKAGDSERTEQEKAELLILQEFLPTALTPDELLEIIDQSISEVGRDFGPVMKSVLSKVNGRADGKVISGLVREKLS